MYDVYSLVYHTDTSKVETTVGVNGVTRITVEPHEDGVGVAYNYWYTDEQGIERQAPGHYCGDAWEAQEFLPSFKAIRGYVPKPGYDFHPDHLLFDDNRNYLTGIGRYSDNLFVVFSKEETERDIEKMPCFWSNESGWGHLEEADEYINKDGYNLPLPDGEWMEYSKARELVHSWVKEN